jgi:hypothetical protein
MTVELLFGRNLMLDQGGSSPYKNAYHHFQCDSYSDIIPKISEVIGLCLGARKRRFFRLHRLPGSLRHVYVKINNGDIYRLGITGKRTAYSYEVQTGDLFKFLYKICQERKLAD